MPKTLSLLLASAALTAAVGLPAWSAMHAPGTAGAGQLLVLVDDDDDEDEGGSEMRRKDDDDGEEDCDDDETGCGSSAAAPAPAGSVPPPQNGLFGTGTPQVKVK